MRDDEFAGFIGGVCQGVERVPEAVQPDVIVAFTDQHEGSDIALAGLTAAEFEQGAVNRFLLGRDAVALVTRVDWSPSDDEPTTPAWLIVGVTFDHPAFFAVRRDLDERWWRIDPPDAPWFALSTAAGLRKAITTGEPIVPKSTFNRALFQRPSDNPVPPLDQDGRL